MPRILVAIIGLAILAFVGVAGIQASLIEAGDDISVTNETFQSPSAGTVIQLDDSERSNAYYDANVTVYNASDVEMDPGVDYDWIQTNGTLKPLSGGDLAGDADGKITYSYQLTTDEEQRIAGLLAQLPRIIGVVLPVLGVIFLFVILRGAS